MKKLFWIAALFICTTPFVSKGHALELDWGGEFRSEYNYIKNYTLDGSYNGTVLDQGRKSSGGYYIAPAGNNDAQFETLFLKLQPKIVVNDNVYIKSEFWLGDPTFGFYGGGSPYSMDQKYYNSTYSRGSTITAQRYWAEFLTDFGTFQVGRVPLQYGLGINWNAGDSPWSHYESTGDAVRLVAKFGAFSFIPQAISYSTGNTVGGACAFNSLNGTCSPLPGGGGMSDYSLQVKYENTDEDFDASINFIRRLIGGGQDPNSGYTGVIPESPTSNPSSTSPSATGVGKSLPGGAAYNTWDIFAKKKLNRLTLGAEIPLVSGNISGINYSTWALAAEADYKLSDAWDFQLHVGHAPGQPSDVSSTPSSFKAYYFHPNYQVGMIMFNYQFANFAGPNNQNNPNTSGANLASPYDNPVTDANYLNGIILLHADKWTFDGSFTFARAVDVCSNVAPAGQPSYCWNNWSRSMVQVYQPDQSNALGWEMDYGAAFQYDESFTFRLDGGLYFPGAFYSFANTSPTAVAAGSPTSNTTSTVLALVARVAISF